MNNIKNIIFDFGGVIIPIEYDAPRRAFEKLGFTDFQNGYSKASQLSVFDDLETGKMDAATFYDRIREISALPLSDTQIREAWNAILLPLPKAHLDWLLELRKSYKIFLLSNTNSIHMEQILLDLKQREGIESLEPYFDTIYLSYELGLRKPHAEIFEHVLRENNLLPAETIFIEDSPQHRETARKLGILSPDHETNADPRESLLSLG